MLISEVNERLRKKTVSELIQSVNKLYIQFQWVTLNIAFNKLSGSEVKMEIADLLIFLFVDIENNQSSNQKHGNDTQAGMKTFNLKLFKHFINQNGPILDLQELFKSYL